MQNRLPHLTLAAALTAVPCLSQSLVVNGSFEQGPPVPGGFLPVNPGSTALTGWTVTRGQIDIVTAFFPPSDGLRFLDLNGTPGSGGVLQSFATTPGDRYVVFFDLWRNTAVSAGPADLRVEVAGTSADFQSVGNDGWTTRVHEFTATGAMTDVELYSLVPPSNGGPLLDLVEVERRVGATTSCAAAPNSTGQVGEIFALNSNAVADDNFVLAAIHLPEQSFGYFIASQTQGMVVGAGGGQGTLCLGGTIGRFDAQIQNSGGHGGVRIDVDLGAIPQPTGSTAVLPGDTWYFQLWHRDANPNTTSNFSEAVEVAFV